MLIDVIIRVLTAIELLFLININGITTASVVMSICVLIILEFSLLISNNILSTCLLFTPFLICLIYLIINSNSYIVFTISSLFIFALSTIISTILCNKMLSYKQKLYKIRDDSVEIENSLKVKNKLLLLEQDQQIHLATLNERNRIAREIHDNVGHMISRAILLLAAIKTVNSDAGIEPQLNMLSDTLDESMQKMRTSVHNLFDDSIDLNRSFMEIIKELSDFKVTTELDFEENLPKEIKYGLIGILKEGVTNIIKHSNGNEVTIILHQNKSFCTLSISDNGKLSLQEKEKIQSGLYDGIGLNNIKQRANACMGDAYFYCNDGFTIFARLNY